MVLNGSGTNLHCNAIKKPVRKPAIQISGHIQAQTNDVNQTKGKTTAAHHLGGRWMALIALESLGYLNWAKLASLG